MPLRKYSDFTVSSFVSLKSFFHDCIGKKVMINLIYLKVIYPVPFDKEQVTYPLEDGLENPISVKKGGRGDAQLRIPMPEM
jgi:hypothetical protein